jgi:hypothetical protein
MKEYSYSDSIFLLKDCLFHHFLWREVKRHSKTKVSAVSFGVWFKFCVYTILLQTSLFEAHSTIKKKLLSFARKSIKHSNYQIAFCIPAIEIELIFNVQHHLNIHQPARALKIRNRFSDYIPGEKLSFLHQLHFTSNHTAGAGYIQTDTKVHLD